MHPWVTKHLFYCDPSFVLMFKVLSDQSFMLLSEKGRPSHTRTHTH